MNNFPKRVENQHGFVEIDFGNEKKILHSKDFSNALNKKNREVFLSLLNKATNDFGKEFTQDGISIYLLKAAIHDTIDSEPVYYYKVSFDGQNYFVKKASLHETIRSGGGVSEVQGMLEAKELIKDIPDVEVVDYKLGYQDHWNTLLVSSWNESLQNTLQNDLEAAKILKNKIELIRSKLKPHFFDVKLQNMAYDKEKEKIIIFDFITKPSKDSDKKMIKIS